MTSSTAPLEMLVDAASLAFTRAFGGVLEIDIEKVGRIFVNGRANPPEVTTEEPETLADCRWISDAATMRRALEGERAVSAAFISGRLRIHGDMSVMARLALEKAP